MKLTDFKKNITKNVEALKDLIKIQSSNGNYNYDEYMYGLGNGLILALSTITGKEPVFLEKPEKWLKNKNK